MAAIDPGIAPSSGRHDHRVSLEQKPAAETYAREDRKDSPIDLQQPLHIPVAEAAVEPRGIALSSSPGATSGNAPRGGAGDFEKTGSFQYSRSANKLVGYFIPFPKPQLPGIDRSTIPDRYLLYTPPPPPRYKPQRGGKEKAGHKFLRKYHEQVRIGRAGTEKGASLKGIRGKIFKGVHWGVDKLTTGNLDFLNRMMDTPKRTRQQETLDTSAEGKDQSVTKKSATLSELILVCPDDVQQSDKDMREEFIHMLIRSKSKAEKDAIIAAGLFPFCLAVDVLACPALAEIDGAWLYTTARGLKQARSTNKRLAPGASESNTKGGELILTFQHAANAQALQQYLAKQCRDRDPRLFPSGETAPNEADVIDSIGWSPSRIGLARGEEEQKWEKFEIQDDLKRQMSKSSKEWAKWCKKYKKNPKRASKK